jgi:hypothetical protein
MDAREDFALLVAANRVRLDDCERAFESQDILLRKAT